MEEILHQFIGGLSHYLHAFYHPRWCRISSIHSRIIWEMVTQIYPPSPTILVRPLCAHSGQLRIASKTHHEWGPCILQRWQAQVVGDAISKFGTQKLKLTKKGWNPSISWLVFQLKSSFVCKNFGVKRCKKPKSPWISHHFPDENADQSFNIRTLPLISAREKLSKWGWIWKNALDSNWLVVSSPLKNMKVS